MEMHLWDFELEIFVAGNSSLSASKIVMKRNVWWNFSALKDKWEDEIQMNNGQKVAKNAVGLNILHFLEYSIWVEG